ncbi:DUF4350 domain-containing protein [Pseudomonas sp. v388]|uniref:DUF4350 domain-containing protein n=1 Tax=Pseudomonas sp. v388 TaxID=2479849 RepID=UPI000F77D790|nr:DUF4350 domain-containing protein [Pseudomonas sp. v388]RRV06676.1 DUF4350 domain-containing protein [Pseudomonas sp. v388]
MTRRRHFMIGLTIALVVALLGVWLFKHLEPYQETVDQGPSPEALANPYLAAEYFLRQRSLPVNVADSLASLPDPQQQRQSLLLLDSRENMTPRQVDELLDWASAGGHLLFVAERLWDAKRGRSGDLLLDKTGIRQYLSKDIKEQERQQDTARSGLPIPLAAPAQQPPRMPWPELTRLYLENEDAPAYMSFNTAYHLEDPNDSAQSWANSAGATHLLQMSHGEGLITVLSDAELWKTRAITRYDNAWLLWYLTQDSAVTLVVQSAHDTLLTLLLRHFPAALVALALLLGMTLWHFGQREGPLQLPAPKARRQLIEHVRACADFLSRRSGQQVLLRNLQHDILRRARQRHPGFEQLAVAEQWQVLARLTRQPTSAISDALRPRPTQRFSRADFTRQVARLQNLRNAL